MEDHTYGPSGLERRSRTLLVRRLVCLFPMNLGPRGKGEEEEEFNHCK